MMSRTRVAAQLTSRRGFLRVPAAVGAGTLGAGRQFIGAATAAGAQQAGPLQSGVPASAMVALPRGAVVRDPYAGLDGLIWWRGQLHTHTSRSFDGHPGVSPARRAALSTAAGHDFTVLTDHDVVTTLAADESTADTVRSHSPYQDVRPVGTAGAQSDPPVALVFPGLESSHPSAHLSVWLLDYVPGAALPDPLVVEGTQEPVRRMEAWAAAGGLVCCNHPSQPTAPLGAEQVASWAGAGAPFRFLEVFNTRANRSPADLAHTRAVWRRAITAAGPERPIWAVAADDSHAADDAGTAYVVVAALELSALALREALLAGRSYASTGLGFTALGADPERGGIVATAPGAATIRFFAADGGVQQETAGESAVYVPAAGDMWVRVEARDAAGTRRAWSQPFWIDA